MRRFLILAVATLATLATLGVSPQLAAHLHPVVEALAHLRGRGGDGQVGVGGECVTCVEGSLSC